MRAIVDDMPVRGRVLVAILLAALALAPFVADRYLLSVLTLILYLAYVGQAWNLMMGYAGQLSLGHALYVGLGGNTGRLEEVAKLCKDCGLSLILDAAHMSGTRLNGENPGKLAEVTVYSYQAVKNLPTADSGMICFADGALDEIVRKKAWLGINKDTYARSGGGGTYKWKYDVEYVGYKDHGNSIMAAIAVLNFIDSISSATFLVSLCRTFSTSGSASPSFISGC